MRSLLPLSFQNRIQELLESTDSKPSLKIAQEQLTKRYRTPQGRTAGFASSSEAMAYVAARLPATFAAVESVLPHVPLEHVTSVLDLGAGPGTAALAAALYWPACERFHLIEEDAFMSKVAQNLLKEAPEIAHQHFSFQRANLSTLSLDAPFDIVTLSYVLNELSSEHQAKVLKKAWEKASLGLIILMPGTPVRYQQLMGLRDLLIEWGAFIAAPCPHHKVCPLKKNDWCHFSKRLRRSRIHRDIKKVSLPYEDEKFSYLVALRSPGIHPAPAARIIRKPLQRSGHVTLDLCASEGLKRQTISKRNKGHYKAATQAGWGDSWNNI